VWRFLKRLLLTLLLLAAGLAGYVYHQLTSLSYDRLTDDVYVIYGLGSNVGVLDTSAGTILVDTMATPIQGKKIRELAEKLTGSPVRVVINTHYHLDHTHGNPAFESGTEIVATAQTKANLLQHDAKFWTGEYTAALPTTTFTDSHQIQLGDKTIRLTHPGQGHTDGDLVALFVEDRVLHAGDLFWHKRYPNIDLEAGASIGAWIDTIERVLGLAPEYDILIPGHGLVTNAAGLRGFQTFLRDLLAVGKDAVAREITVEQAIAEPVLRPYADYEVMEIPFILKLDRDFVIRRSVEEASGAFTYTRAEIAK
jgi:cyclase